jgi:hypothetical protein
MAMGAWGYMGRTLVDFSCTMNKTKLAIKKIKPKVVKELTEKVMRSIPRD